MRFASPGYLLLLLLLVPLAWWELKKRTGTIKYSDTAFFKTRSSRGKIFKAVLLALNILALACMTLALARPQKGRIYEEVETSGVDIMLCLDISATMQAEDFHPVNRLYVAKQRAKEFIEKRKGDRIGLVLFATQTLTQCPLTNDHKILIDLIDRIDFGIVSPNQTAIGLGLANAVSRLKNSQSKEKIIILLTDGKNNAGEIDPNTAAQIAQSYKIKVYCIGVGTKAQQNVAFYRYYDPTNLELDMDILDNISNLTGGKAFLATDAEALKVIYEEIDRMEPTTFKVMQHTLYSEKAGIFMVPGLIIALISILLSVSFLRRLP